MRHREDPRPSPHLELRLRRLAVVQAKVVARLEVDGQRAVGKRLQVHRENLEADVVVVQLAVAQRHVHVQRQELAVLQQQALVDVRRLLEVAAQVVDRRQAQLVLRGVRQLLVVPAEEGGEAWTRAFSQSEGLRVRSCSSPTITRSNKGNT